MSGLSAVRTDYAVGLNVSPLTPTIGAEVLGVDLSKPISDSVRDEIKATLLLSQSFDMSVRSAAKEPAGT